MKLEVSKTHKNLVDPTTKQVIEYDERLLIVDGISYKVSKNEAKVFDLQFKDLLSGKDKDAKAPF